MSRTDNTRPYEVQAKDPMVAAVISHDSHHDVYAYYRKDPVTWRQLVEHFEEPGYRFNEEIVWCAYFGKPRRSINAVSVIWNPDRVRRLIERYLDYQVTIDPGDEFTDDTLVGYHNTYCTITTYRRECSEDCRRQLRYWGGIKAESSTNASLDRRQKRAIVSGLLRQAKHDPDVFDAIHPSRVHRHAAWLD